MKCDNCGHDNVEGARFCASCGITLPVGNPDERSLIGQVVGGRYRIVGLIGEGGMGIVYKAEQTLGSAVRPVAVKTLHAELSRDPAVTARFHREVGTVAQLEHPNTVKVYDFGSTADGTLYIAMEYLDGKSLARIIETEGAMSLERIDKIVRQIAGSLEEAHAQGIIHRDLKPENVLLVGRAGERDVVKLVDFGIAARTESADRAKEQKLTQQGTVLGTPPYMSPEQFTGKALDARSDIYSLGVMVYEMLTRELPFQANTAWEWATQHMTSQPREFDLLEAGARIPKAVRDVVMRALAKDPTKRQPSAREFEREFSTALQQARTAPAVAVDVAAATQAMAQAPEVAIPATAAMPAAPSPVALPPAPPRQKPSGGKGLVMVLGGVSGVLLLAIGAVLLKDQGGSTEMTPLGQPPASAPPAVLEAETPTQSTAQAPPAGEEPTLKPEEPEPKPKSTATASSPPKNPPPKTTATPPAQTPPATPPTTPATTPPAPPTPPPPATTPPPAAPPAADPCTQCLAAVQRSDIEAAARYHSACKNQQAAASCASRAGVVAPNLVRAAANNQKCDRARSVAAAAQQMGYPASRLEKPLSACK
jgi:eukaryotic-like serine/threonine-protein kinase